MRYEVDLSEASKFARTPACGPDGGTLGATNRFLTRDGSPWIPIAGEMHYSRIAAERWDTELAKMAAAGIDVVSTYVFWNHHEEREGEWDFSGNRNVRRFVELCARHGLHVIVRLGPFCHGEVRNGGLPDWLYGKSYEVRSLDAGFLDAVRGLYAHIAQQLRGLYFKDGGPIIAAQVDNEYMASSAPWEMTTGISREWVPSGHDGAGYLERLRDIAIEEGIDPPMFTCTGWQSPVPDDMLPLWGGYAYRPWLFYDGVGAEGMTEHPATDEYRYRRLHGSSTSDGFDPPYDPDSRPYACCEMGGGMFNSYDYRFVLPKRSVDAMANIKLGSGCDFLGYYMFHGGTNPKGAAGFLNEGQTPKRSYDFQAPLGEFGQVRESYRRLRTLHEFVKAFGPELAGMPVSLQDGQDRIDPSDSETLRYAVRSDGERGFVSIDNFQDHARVPSRHGEQIDVTTGTGERIRFTGIGLAVVANSLAAVRKLVFEDKVCTMDTLAKALQANWEGYEDLRAKAQDCPKYGNDDDYVDDIATKVANHYYHEVHQYKDVFGNPFTTAFMGISNYIPMGRVLGATPCGRRNGDPSSEGVSPYVGTDKSTPLAAMRSTTKVNQEIHSGGTLLNLRLDPNLVATKRGQANLGAMIQTLFSLGAFHVQFNCISSDTLRDAQAHPENYRDLLVRVAGYSTQFVNLSKSMQDAIIARTEHTGF